MEWLLIAVGCFLMPVVGLGVFVVETFEKKSKGSEHQDQK